MGWDDPAYVPAIVAPAPILNALDRCDWCGSRAYARALFEPLSEEQRTAYLNMCGHHYRTAPISLHERAYHVIDETDRILKEN